MKLTLTADVKKEGQRFEGSGRSEMWGDTFDPQQMIVALAVIGSVYGRLYDEVKDASGATDEEFEEEIRRCAEATDVEMPRKDGERWQ